MFSRIALRLSRMWTVRSPFAAPRVELGALPHFHVGHRAGSPPRPQQRRARPEPSLLETTLVGLSDWVRLSESTVVCE